MIQVVGTIRVAWMIGVVGMIGVSSSQTKARAGGTSGGDVSQ